MARERDCLFHSFCHFPAAENKSEPINKRRADTNTDALTIYKCGRWDEALQLERKVLQNRIRILGLSHRATLDSFNALGFSLHSQGKFKEAAEMHRVELEEKRKLLRDEPDDWGLIRDVNIAESNIGRGKAAVGDFEGAEEMYRSVLTTNIKTSGWLHPDTFITRGELAATLRDANKLEEAEVRIIFRSALGHWTGEDSVFPFVNIRFTMLFPLEIRIADADAVDFKGSLSCTS